VVATQRVRDLTPQVHVEHGMWGGRATVLRRTDVQRQRLLRTGNLHRRAIRLFYERRDLSGRQLRHVWRQVPALLPDQ